MNLSESLEWEIPKSKIDNKLDQIHTTLEKLVDENKIYKEKIVKQEKTIKKIEDDLSKNRIMYVELLKMHKKFHLETKNLLENHKKIITKQLENNNMGYKEIINVMQDNKSALLKLEKLESENKNIKPMLDKIKKNNNKIKNNLSSAILRYRNDNILWRSYSTKFNKTQVKNKKFTNIMKILED